MSATADNIQLIFFAAIEKHSPEQQRSFLDDACAGNTQLRARVEELLAAHLALGSIHQRISPADSAILEQTRERLGTSIGPYKLLEQIGEGGMGLVYMAEQQQPVRRKVALKIIKPGMDTKEIIARFESERQALALMDHPHIARVFDAGATESGRPFFVMELVKGTPLTQYCDDNHLRAEERLELFIQVCNALQHAHQKGIIHRDLKPSNVMVTMHDGRPVPKVIDFGVAKATLQILTERTLFTAYGQMIGTPAYMSPEQAEMSGLDIDTRSDIYSLGVLLYELLTGTTPFDSKRLREAGFAEMARIIREEEPETVSARIARTRVPECGMRSSERGTAEGSNAPRSALGAAGFLFNPKPRIQDQKLSELDWIVAKSLEKDRERRYESASSFARDIRRYLSDEPVQACPPSTLYRLRKYARRNKRALAMLATIAVALLASVVALTVAYLQTSVAYQKVNEKQLQTQEALDRERQTLNRERQTLYYHRVALANSSFWAENDVGRAEHLLDECPHEFRHWEWHYLKRLCHADVLTLPHPGTNVPALAYSKDRRRLATGGQSAVTIWDLQTGAKLLSCRGQTGVVSSLAFSPDGKQLVSASDDQTVKLWDAQTGAEIRTFPGHHGPVCSVAYSPAGGMLASAGQDQTVKLWDVTTGDEIVSFKGHTGPVRAVAFSQDGQRLASAGEDSTVRVWDLQARQELLTLRGHKSWVLCVAFHPEGKLLVSGGYDWTARIWDLATGQDVRSLAGHKHYVSGVDFSQDGRQLATSSFDQTIKLWDVASGNEIRTLRGHTHSVAKVAFCDGGRKLASASYDQTVKIWDSAASQEARTISMPHGEVHHAAFSPDGQRLATAGGDNNVRIWDVATRRELLVLTGHTWRVWGVAFSKDGQKLASAGGRRGDPDPADVKIWDAATGSELLTLSGHKRTVRSVAFSPDGRRLASAGNDHTIKLWDLATGRELYTITGHSAGVISVAFSPRGGHLASASMDKTVKLWDAATGQLIRAFTGHNHGVYDVVFSPDGQRLASVGSTGPSRLIIWDAATGQEIHNLPVNTAPLHALAISPDGRRIATTSYDGTVKIWDAITGRETLTLKGHTNAVWGAAFSPDGRCLATASYDGTAKIWDATPLPDP